MEEIKKVLIVGGGTAASLSALYLRTHLPDSIHISLLTPENNKSIGVGEATIPTLRFTMRSLGLREEEWMPACGATLKAAIKFENWHGQGHEYYHPFHQNKDLELNNIHEFAFGGLEFPLLQYVAQQYPGPEFLDHLSIVPSLCGQNKVPKDQDFLSLNNYAYHLDSQKFAAFLKTKAVERGVQHEQGSVKEASLNPNGTIDHLILDDQRTLKADFYLDCTGFSKQLIQKAMRGTFISYDKKLFVNRAVALSFETTENLQVPYTTAKAQKSGWIWKTPLKSRLGAGYVFHSDFCSDEEAIVTLKGEFTSGVYQESNPRFIAMEAGQQEKSWIKNCVAIGLSSSFIEPLESTTIGMTEYQLSLLKDFFPQYQDSPDLAKAYNHKVSYAYDNICDFIRLHYLLSNRQDSDFWRSIQKKKEEQLSSIDLYQNFEHYILQGFPRQHYVMFNKFNYLCVFLGLGYQMKTSIPTLSLAPAHEKIQRRLEFLKERADQNISSALKNSEYLQLLYNPSK